ncbi:unnamed protein product [Orchesella dallaii]|uniref:Uncharacterized protein n=1 Tax=Orchesella dallaii TaxID=48710 RepID=A0ABP1Q3I7_9HEXA
MKANLLSRLFFFCVCICGINLYSCAIAPILKSPILSSSEDLNSNSTRNVVAASDSNFQGNSMSNMRPHIILDKNTTRLSCSHEDVAGSGPNCRTDCNCDFFQFCSLHGYCHPRGIRSTRRPRPRTTTTDNSLIVDNLELNKGGYKFVWSSDIGIRPENIYLKLAKVYDRFNASFHEMKGGYVGSICRPAPYLGNEHEKYAIFTSSEDNEVDFQDAMKMCLEEITGRLEYECLTVHCNPPILPVPSFLGIVHD